MTPISKELEKQIKKDAQAVRNRVCSKEFTEYQQGLSDGVIVGYEAGATAYAHYKERWEQAIKALERIANLSIPEAIINVQDKLLVLQAIANEALASWKDEGKEENDKTQYNPPPMSTQAKEILEKHLNNCNVISRQMDREAENVQTALKLTINECARKRAQPLLDALNKIKIIAKRHGEISNVINEALASWMDEGKEGGNG